VKETAKREAVDEALRVRSEVADERPYRVEVLTEVEVVRYV
jgi:hypothetical protein